jgi:hypothetical protein
VTAVVIDRNERDLSRVIFLTNQLGQGRTNANGTVTLDDGETSTTVAAPNCAEGSGVFLSARTANAAAALATAYVGTVSNGSFVITHANNAQTDRNFFWVALG